MAPADMRKEGSAFDVPIALGILSASGQIGPEELPQERLDQFMIMGELALSEIPTNLKSPPYSSSQYLPQLPLYG